MLFLIFISKDVVNMVVTKLVVILDDESRESLWESAKQMAKYYNTLLDIYLSCTGFKFIKENLESFFKKFILA